MTEKASMDWDIDKQTYVLRYKDIIIECNRRMTVIAPAAMVKACHPPEVPRETIKNKRTGNLQFMNKGDQSRMNTGLGVEQRHVKEHLITVAGETGKRYEEIGNDTPNIHSTQREFKVSRGEVEFIKANFK